MREGHMFEKKRDDGTTDSDILMQLVSSHAYGSVITYESFEEAFSAGMDRPATRKEVQSAVFRTLPRIRLYLRKHLQAVDNIGYKIVTPEEQVTVHVDKKRRKIKRQVDASLSIALNAEESMLSKDARGYRMHAITTSSVLQVNMRREENEAKRMGLFFRGEG
jgi:hypothetical protein